MAEATGALFGPLNAETGDTSQFDSVTVEGSNTFTAESGAAAHGSYGFRITGAQSEGARGIIAFTENSDVYLRAYIYIPSTWATVDTGITYAKILMLTDGGTEVSSFQIRMDTTSGEIDTYRVYHRDNTGTLQYTNLTQTAIDDDTWHYIEIRFYSNNGAGVSEAWLDGSSLGSSTGLSTSNYLPDSAEIGTQNSDNATWDTGSTIDFDDIIGDTSYIGEYEDAGGGGTTYNVSASDGISLSDASIGNLRIQAAVSDGIALGDSDSGSLAIQAAAADGLSLSDLASALFHFQVVTADGIVLSDQATYGGQIIVSAADGITLSDMAGAALKHLAAITDGIVLSDVVSGVLRYSVTVNDGVSFSDALAAAVKMVLQVSDGIKLSDLVVDTTFLPSGKVSITISSRQASITFSSRAPGVGFST